MPYVGVYDVIVVIRCAACSCVVNIVVVGVRGSNYYVVSVLGLFVCIFVDMRFFFTVIIIRVCEWVLSSMQLAEYAVG